MKLHGFESIGKNRCHKFFDNRFPDKSKHTTVAWTLYQYYSFPHLNERKGIMIHVVWFHQPADTDRYSNSNSFIANSSHHSFHLIFQSGLLLFRFMGNAVGLSHKSLSSIVIIKQPWSMIHPCSNFFGGYCNFVCALGF